MSTPVTFTWTLDGAGNLTAGDNPLPSGADLGVDIACINEIPSSFSLAKGYTNLAMALLRRLQTPRGFLAEAFDDDPEYGYDLLERLNDELTEAELGGIDGEVEAELRKDERVEDITTSFVFSRADNAAELTIDVHTADGPFRLILKISDLTTTILNEGLPSAADA